MSEIVTSISPLTSCAISLLKNLANTLSGCDSLGYTKCVKELLDRKLIKESDRDGWLLNQPADPYRYILVSLTEAGKALELEIAKSEIQSEQGKVKYYWREKGFTSTIAWTLSSSNIKNEDELRDFGYDNLMHLQLSYDRKRAICRFMKWEMPTPHQISNAWKACGFTKRVINILTSEGIIDEAGLRQYSDAELLRIPNFGKVSLQEVHRWLKGNDLYTDHAGFMIKRDPLPSLRSCTNEELLEEIKRRIRHPL